MPMEPNFIEESSGQDDGDIFLGDIHIDDIPSEKLLIDLPFKDLYIRIDDSIDANTHSRYNPTPGPDVDEYVNLKVPPEYNTNLNMLRNDLRKVGPTIDFRVFFEGIRFRAVRMETVSSDPSLEKEVWVCLRRFPTKTPDIDKMNYTEANREIMKGLGRKQGLIVIGGGTGAGKTTTGISLFRFYMKSIGGVGYMVEDPCEYILQGDFEGNPEKAMVLQCEVTEEEQWVQAIKNGLRCNPKFVYLGEVRTPDSAAQMLRMASSGHLVICTVHGGTVEQCVSALVQIARSKLDDLANQLLADSLVAIIHQTMSRGRVNMTILKAEGMADGVRAAIRDGDLKKLANSIEQQRNQADKVIREKQAAAAQHSTTQPQGQRRPQQGRQAAPAVEKKKGWFK